MKHLNCGNVHHDCWKRGVWGFIIGVVLAIGVCAVANGAEADSLYFTSATDLIAQVDSICGCDTVMVYYEPIPLGAILLDYGDSLCWATLRCRELVSVAVVEPVSWTFPEGVFNSLNMPAPIRVPGQAVAWTKVRD